MKSIQFNNTKHTFCLIEDVSELPKIDSSQTMGLCVESTGVDYTRDKIVGISIAVMISDDEIISYYIPVRHTKGKNIDLKASLALVQSILDNNKVFIANREFVFTFLEKEGVRCSLNRTHDTQIMLYLCTSKPHPSRNEYAHLYFPDMPIYELDMEQQLDFSNQYPEYLYNYAAQKALLNILLAKKVWTMYPMIHEIYRLDNESNEVIRWLCMHTEMPISKPVIRNELDKTNYIIDKITYELKSKGFIDYDLNDAMKRLEIVQSVMGDSIKSLSDFAIRDSENAVVQLVKQYGEQANYRATLEKMLNYNDTMRIHYSTVTAATGRLTSGAMLSNSYYNDFNIQNVEKKEEIRYLHKTDCGIGFTIDDNPDDAVREVKCKGGLRDAFVCPEGYVWVSADYSGEEMVLAACFSKEENLIEPIREGKDIHRHIAGTMFGQEDDESRSRIKQLNFSVIYGATAYSIAKRLKISLEECSDMLTKYFEHLKGIRVWRDKMIAKARSKGYVCTLFGRPRMLFEMYNTGQGSAADRCACNSPIQGCTPLSGHLETEHSAIRMETIIGHKVKDTHGKYIIPTHRGDREPLFCLFKSGDYLICDYVHSLVYGDKKAPKVAYIRDIMNKRQRVWLAELRKKRWKLNRFFFKSSAECASLFTMMCKRDNEIKDDNVTLNSALLKLALSGHWFKADYNAAVSLRSVASIFGYNVIYSSLRDKFKVSFFRRRRTKIKSISWCFTNDRKVPVGSCTKITDMQMYDNQGFVNKNTGADIIRIDLCKFKKLFDTDEEWRENVKFACTVHDECNFYVKETYLYKAVKKIYDTMYFEHPLMALPLKVSISVGNDWGHLLDVDLEQVKENNTVQI